MATTATSTSARSPRWPPPTRGCCSSSSRPAEPSGCPASTRPRSSGVSPAPGRWFRPATSPTPPAGAAATRYGTTYCSATIDSASRAQKFEYPAPSAQSQCLSADSSQRVRWVKPLPVLGGQLPRPRDESRSTAGVTNHELRRAAGPRRESDPHDRPDVGVRRRRQHTLVEALLRFQRLGEQHPVDHVLQRWPRLPGLKRRLQTRPQADPFAVGVLVETGALQPRRPPDRDHLVDDRLRRMGHVGATGVL